MHHDADDYERHGYPHPRPVAVEAIEQSIDNVKLQHGEQQLRHEHQRQEFAVLVEDKPACAERGVALLALLILAHQAIPAQEDERCHADVAEAREQLYHQVDVGVLEVVAPAQSLVDGPLKLALLDLEMVVVAYVVQHDRRDGKATRRRALLLAE